MRRLGMVLVVVLVAGVWPTQGAAARGSAAQVPAAEGVRADFNGDGGADLAIGAPGEDAGSVVDAGAVIVLPSHEEAPLTGVGSLLVTQNSAGGSSGAEPGDGLGAALAAGDFNNDGFADLAIGVPGEDRYTVANTGAVNVLYGSVSGLNGAGSPPSQLFTQASIGRSSEAGDRFGDVLASGDFNNDGFADLAVGAPGEDVDSVGDAGAVNILRGSDGGLAGSSREFTQNTPGVGGSAEPGDGFGGALATADFNNDGFADLAVGSAGEDWYTVADAGAVNGLSGSDGGLVAPGGQLQLFTQNSPGVGGSAEPGDGFGSALTAGDFDVDGFADLAVGVPGENVGSVVDAGAVNVLYGLVGGLTGGRSQLFTQNSPGVGSSAEPGDGFGFALATADFNEDSFADLAVGVPFETGAAVAQGAVHLLLGAQSAGGLTGGGSRLLTQNSPGVGSSAETGDLFGSALTAAEIDQGAGADLAVGVPGENVGTVANAGAVNVLYGGVDLFTHQLFTQNSPGVASSAEQGDLFGAALTTSN